MSASMADKKPSTSRRNKRTALIFGAVALGWFVLDLVWHLFYPYH